MTKAKARMRAKAKAAAKAVGGVGKIEAKSGNPDIKAHPGKFDPKTPGLKGSSPNIKNAGPQRRGAARSR